MAKAPPRRRTRATAHPTPPAPTEFEQAAATMTLDPPEPRPMAPPANGRQTFLARHRARRETTMETPDDIAVADLDGRRGGRRTLGRGQLAGQVTVEHETDAKIRLWKQGPYGWFPREVPSSSMPNNLQQGWMEYCPDCGTTNCTDDPNSCAAKVAKRYLECPVVHANGTPCGRRIYAVGFVSEADTASDDDPNRMTDVYSTLDTQRELKGKMDQHILRFHADEARMLGIIDTDALYAAARGA